MPLFDMISAPKSQGWKMPAEWHSHDCCWMLWPFRTDNWRNNAKEAQIAFSNVAKAIGKFESVKIGVLSELLAGAQSHFSPTDNVTLEVFEYDDSWIRDSGPTFLLNDSDNVSGVHWKFNAWGCIYEPFDKDERVAERVLQISNTITSFVADFILEGGSFHVDGEGTILTTEECLLHPNRNPHLNKEQIEQLLLHYLGGEKVIWLKRGLTADEDTNGHIDNIACFSRPGEVVLSWTDDESDPQYAISREAHDILSSTLDARGRSINIVKLYIPPPMHYTEEDCALLTSSAASASGTSTSTNTVEGEKEGELSRQVGERLAASYANFYIANGGVDANGVSHRGIVCPSFHPETDEHAMAVLQSVFPGYEVVMVPGGRDILLGGGNIHCITQQQPRASRE